MSTADRWIIDSDCGIDDAQGIFLGLKHLNLVGITTVSGNASAANAANNISIIQGVKKTEVPIFIGAERGIIEEAQHIPEIHGADGFGNMAEKYQEYANKDLVKDEHATNAIIRLSKEAEAAGAKLNIATIGPLTNVALAIRLDPELPKRVGEIWVMGGTANAFGNITLSAEYNFVTDPEASKIVVESFERIHLLPWETGDNLNITTYDETEVLFKDKDTNLAVQMFYDVNQWDKTHADMRIYCCDGLCIGAIADRDIIEEQKIVYGKVFIEGEARGSIFFNHCPVFIPDGVGEENVVQILKINHGRYVKLLADAVRD